MVQGRPAYLRLEKDHSQAVGAARDPWPCLQEAWERSLAEMESSHQQVMEELQRHHERELQRLQQEKEWLLAEETAATASGEDPGKEWHSGQPLNLSAEAPPRWIWEALRLRVRDQEELEAPRIGL